MKAIAKGSVMIILLGASAIPLARAGEVILDDSAEVRFSNRICTRANFSGLAVVKLTGTGSRQRRSLEMRGHTTIPTRASLDLTGVSCGSTGSIIYGGDCFSATVTCTP